MTMSWTVRTANIDAARSPDGQKAWAGGSYTAIPERSVMFRVGQTEMVFEVPLKDMKPGWEIAIIMAKNEDYPQVTPTVSGKITCVEGALPNAIGYSPPAPLPLPPLGRLIRTTDFINGFSTSPQGSIGSFATCNAMWDDGGRWINDELGIYGDPSIIKGVDLFPLINGARHLAIHQVPLYVWKGRQFAYVQPMLSTMNMISTCYGVFELTFTLPREADGNLIINRGVLSAWWQVDASGKKWPPERDFFEQYPAEDRMTYTDHWLDNGVHKKFIRNPWMGDMGIDRRGELTVTVECRPDVQRTWLNGKLHDEAPNIHNYFMMHIWSMALGGEAAGSVSKVFKFPITMALKNFTAWELGV
jgi:hypothetical protein